MDPHMFDDAPGPESFFAVGCVIGIVLGLAVALLLVLLIR